MSIRLILILIILSSKTFIFGQKPEDLLYEVTIQSGTGFYGTTSVKFQLEGMVLRSSGKYENDKYERKVDFVPIQQIDSKKMLKFFEYIFKNNLMNIEYNYTQNQYYPVDMIIRILDMRDGNYIQYRYNKYCPLFDKLIILLNDLIPKKHKNIYEIKRIPK